MEDTRLCVRSSFFRNVDALPERDHQRVQEALFFLFVVVLAKHRLDCFGSLLGVVKGDAAEKVVNDMVINDFVEEVAANESGCPVNSGQCSFGIGPGLCGVVWNSRVSVLKICDSDCKLS